jgi:mannose/fructose/N-acetylgalactosamine-specific phosphotransferase system component IID
MEKKISPQSLNSVLWRWYHGAASCGTYAMLEAVGYAASIIPALKDLYPDKEEFKEKLQTYGVFYNTEIFLGSIVLGINCALEEARANNRGNVDGEVINSIRTGLMGPIAGVGDSLIIGTYIPILLGIAVGLSQGGSIVGPLFYVLVWNISLILFMKYIFNRGYKLGYDGIGLLVGPGAKAVKEALVTLGLIVVGAISATWINVSTAYKMTSATGTTFVDLQSTLNGVFPNLLTLVFIGVNYWLLTKKGVKPLVVILLMFVVTFVGVLLGIFNPGMSY